MWKWGDDVEKSLLKMINSVELIGKVSKKLEVQIVDQIFWFG